jgi:hypothetical protein
MTRRIIEGEPDYRAASKTLIQAAKGRRLPIMHANVREAVDAALAGRVLSGPTPDMIERAAKVIDDEIGNELREHLGHIMRKWPNTIHDIAEAALVAALWGDEPVSISTGATAPSGSSS